MAAGCANSAVPELSWPRLKGALEPQTLGLTLESLTGTLGNGGYRER